MHILCTAGYGAWKAANRLSGLTTALYDANVWTVVDSVIVIPWSTNQSWKHCVPKVARYRGRRISITLRAFRAVGSARRPV